MKNHAVNVKIFSLFIFNALFYNVPGTFLMLKHILLLRFLHYYSEFMRAEKNMFSSFKILSIVCEIITDF